MLLSTFSFCICAFVHAVAVSTPRYVVCRHSCCLMLLFEGHVTCRSFTLTGPRMSEVCILNPLVCWIYARVFKLFNQKHNFFSSNME